jgi:hypothetical protein
MEDSTFQELLDVIEDKSEYEKTKIDMYQVANYSAIGSALSGKKIKSIFPEPEIAEEDKKEKDLQIINDTMPIFDDITAI